MAALLVLVEIENLNGCKREARPKQLAFVSEVLLIIDMAGMKIMKQSLKIGTRENIRNPNHQKADHPNY